MDKYKLTKTYIYQRTNEYELDEDGKEATTSIDTTDELDPYYTIYERVDNEWEEWCTYWDKDEAREEYTKLMKGKQ